MSSSIIVHGKYGFLKEIKLKLRYLIKKILHIRSVALIKYLNVNKILYCKNYIKCCPKNIFKYLALK